MKEKFTPLRQKLHNKLLTEWNTPIVIYIAVFIGILGSLALSTYHPDLSLNLVSEILGAAFTLFVIDFLLVKTKTKRWIIVREHIDYLIARTVNRLRDGISTRVFSFVPSLLDDVSEEEVIANTRAEREALFQELVELDIPQLSERISSELFTEDNYEYFNEKADDIWSILNMKYSEYLAPPLVSLLIELHTNLKDVGGHIRMYNKSKRFPSEKEYYQSAGKEGAAGSFKKILRVVIRLKQEGYSQLAKATENDAVQEDRYGDR